MIMRSIPFYFGKAFRGEEFFNRKVGNLNESGILLKSEIVTLDDGNEAGACQQNSLFLIPTARINI